LLKVALNTITLKSTKYKWLQQACRY
jgi:hypothetical protein